MELGGHDIRFLLRDLVENAPQELIDAELSGHAWRDDSVEIHVHGYDLKFGAEEGVPLTIEFSAEVEGIRELELESADLHLFDIRGDPRFGAVSRSM
jgi:hypothetical protein